MKILSRLAVKSHLKFSRHKPLRNPLSLKVLSAATMFKNRSKMILYRQSLGSGKQRVASWIKDQLDLFESR